MKGKKKDKIEPLIETICLVFIIIFVSWTIQNIKKIKKEQKLYEEKIKLLSDKPDEKTKINELENKIKELEIKQKGTDKE